MHQWAEAHYLQRLQYFSYIQHERQWLLCTLWNKSTPRSCKEEFPIVFWQTSCWQKIDARHNLLNRIFILSSGTLNMSILAALRYRMCQDVTLSVSPRIKPISLLNSCSYVHWGIYIQFVLLEVIVSCRELNPLLCLCTGWCNGNATLCASFTKEKEFALYKFVTQAVKWLFIHCTLLHWDSCSVPALWAGLSCLVLCQWELLYALTSLSECCIDQKRWRKSNMQSWKPVPEVQLKDSTQRGQISSFLRVTTLIFLQPPLKKGATF